MLYCACISNFTQFLLYLKGSLLAVGTYNNEIEQFIYMKPEETVQKYVTLEEYSDSYK